MEVASIHVRLTEAACNLEMPLLEGHAQKEAFFTMPLVKRKQERGEANGSG
jgi:hypothetical protein